MLDSFERFMYFLTKQAVGAALLWTLKEGLGEIFTRDVDAAWTAIFRILADVMIEGGKEGLAEVKSRSTGDE
jgi:hemoglobin-like flavoprotein